MPLASTKSNRQWPQYLTLVCQIDLGITRLLWVGKERTTGERHELEGPAFRSATRRGLGSAVEACAGPRDFKGTWRKPRRDRHGPHSESATLAAAPAAGLVIIPCRPAILDLRAIASTVDLRKIAKKPACIVFNAVPPRGSLADEAVTAVQMYELPIVPVRIGQRVAYVHALTLGRKIQQLYKWTCRHVGDSA
jgi:hypothetical protein